jgi:hypothetical protein
MSIDYIEARIIAKYDDLPDGTQVADHAGDTWTKTAGEWRYAPDHRPISTEVLIDLGPLTIQEQQ